MKRYDVIVIGAGPAGLAAGISSAKTGASVCILERMERPGLKLLASGGGRCNITNVKTESDFITSFGKNGRFMISSLRAFTRDDLLAWFRQAGVPVHCADEFHYFPVSEKATDVLNALLTAYRNAGGILKTDMHVDELATEKNGSFTITCGTSKFSASAVVLAAGGPSRPRLGADGSGYELAEQTNHSTISPVPALVGLVTEEKWPCECSGIVLPKVKARINLSKYKKEWFCGDLLFTHRGISGPVILDLSGYASRELNESGSVSVVIDFLPEKNREETERELTHRASSEGKKLVRNMLPSRFRGALPDIFCRKAGLRDGCKGAELPAKARRKLVDMIHSTIFAIRQTEGSEKAMAVNGGVNLKEVHPGTLQSKAIPSLFFCGEILDIDGPCGGYNLQWAFSSGMLAGENAAKKRD